MTQKLWAEPNWLVVLDYSDYAPHRHDLLGTKLEGPAPTLATLTDGTYPAARPVYVYGQRRQLDANTGARMLAYSLNNMYDCRVDSPCMVSCRWTKSNAVNRKRSTANESSLRLQLARRSRAAYDALLRRRRMPRSNAAKSGLRRQWQGLYRSNV